MNLPLSPSFHCLYCRRDSAVADWKDVALFNSVMVANVVQPIATREGPYLVCPRCRHVAQRNVNGRQIVTARFVVASDTVLPDEHAAHFLHKREVTAVTMLELMDAGLSLSLVDGNVLVGPVGTSYMDRVNRLMRQSGTWRAFLNAQSNEDTNVLALFESVINKDPSAFLTTTEDNPVFQVTKKEIMEFAERLSTGASESMFFVHSESKGDLYQSTVELNGRVATIRDLVKASALEPLLIEATVDGNLEIKPKPQF